MEKWQYASGGWSRCGVCKNPIDFPFGYEGDWYSGINPANCNDANACLDGQGGGFYSPWPISYPSAARQLVKFGRYTPNRDMVIEAWTRPGPAIPNFIPHWTPPAPMVHPWSPPRFWPATAPMPFPRPIPIRLVPERAPDPWEPPPAPDVTPSPPAARKRVLEWAGSRPRISSQPNTRRTPRRNEKEKKFKGSSGAARMIFGKLARGKEAITEMDDFIDNIFEALPKSEQKKLKGRKTPQDKLKSIYDNFDKVDWEQAGKNIAKNWIEDRLMGSALGAANKISDKLGQQSRLALRDIAKKAGPSFSDVADRIVDTLWQ